MAKIYAPNKGYTGVSASVPFCNGVGMTDDKHLIQWFREHGYTVEEEKPSKKKPDASQNSKPDKKGSQKRPDEPQNPKPDETKNPKPDEEPAKGSE